MIEFISQLPTEYQEVEYIQSSGTQYIDTGVVATSGFEIDIKINIDTVTGSWAPILSAHELSAPYKRNFIAYTSSKKMEIDAGDKITQTSVTLTGDDVIKASNVENNFYLNVNGTNYTPTVTTAASHLAYSGRTMHLLHSNGYDFGYTSGKVYYCKITVHGTLVRNFVPCYRKSDNIVGLYDLVNGVFYTNAGTGNFAKGKNSNSHSDVLITPGGTIPMQYALRRRMMINASKGLPIGTLIRIADSDGGSGAANYEIADINNLVPGGVVLVRKNIYSKSAFGSNINYSGSTLDNLIKTTIYNKMPQKLRNKMMDVSFPLYSYLLSASENITRKMFALTKTMAGFGDNNGVAEGKALQLYTSDASRVKTFNGSTDGWWLSSQYSSIFVRHVSSSGFASGGGKSQELGVVPAFAIPQPVMLEDSANTDGSYNLIL